MTIRNRGSVHNATAYRVNEDALLEVLDRVRRRIEGVLPEVSVAFVQDETMVRLHEEYYGEDGSTDVLAFPYGDDTAEIVINPSYLRREAGTQPINRAVVDILVHAVLHLAGFDHTRGDDEGAHFDRQDAIMDRLQREELPRIIEPPNFRSKGDEGSRWV